MARAGIRAARLAVAVLFPFVLAACGSVQTRPPDVPLDDPDVKRDFDKYGRMFGEDAFVFSTERKRAEPGATGIGVNAYLWRATLDVLDFVPIASADPFGGLVVTEWYRPEETPDERFKITVLIKDRRLRASALEVSVHKQRRASDGGWVDVAAPDELARQIEDRILTRARELRIADVRPTG